MRGLLDRYDFGSGYDEMFVRPGVPRPHCQAMFDALAALQRRTSWRMRANAPTSPS